jgi:pimeloyl-ACP methyl ester carboxylesterase
MGATGSGAGLVFLHAYPLNAGLWEPQRAAFGDRKVLAPNFPGFGGEPVGATTLEGFAEKVVTEMDAAGIPKATIVGLSMGGYVAFRLLERWPDRVAALVLADTRAGADGEAGKTKRTAQAERVREDGIGWLPDAVLPDLLGASTHRERPAVVDRVRSLILQADPEGVARALLAMRDRPDSTDLLAAAEVPVLAITGEEDTLIPGTEAHLIAQRAKNGRIVSIPKAGHISSLENPEAFNQALKSFLEEVGT